MPLMILKGHLYNLKQGKLKDLQSQVSKWLEEYPAYHQHQVYTELNEFLGDVVATVTNNGIPANVPFEKLLSPSQKLWLDAYLAGSNGLPFVELPLAKFPIEKLHLNLRISTSLKKKAELIAKEIGICYTYLAYNT
jgi:hypothetical protein